MSTSRQYELIYIVSPDATEQEVADLHAQVEASAAPVLGLHQLAREPGHRGLDLINGSGELMKEIERRLRVSDRIMRYLVVRVDEELRAAERARARRKAVARPPQGGGEGAEAPAAGTDGREDAEVL